MGTLTRRVTLSEGAKPGIPTLEYYRINTETVQMTILVSKPDAHNATIDGNNHQTSFQEPPAEYVLSIIGFEIEYIEKSLDRDDKEYHQLDWDLAYHQYFDKSKNTLIEQEIYHMNMKNAWANVDVWETFAQSLQCPK